MSTEKVMRRGVQQALYKYLPGAWVDFSQSGGGASYAVHVDTWNSIPLNGINNKRLLRVINRHVQSYRIRNGNDSTVDFSSTINEENYDVLTPKVSDTISAIRTSVKPWVFVCGKCGKVRQYYYYDEFKRKEHEPCEVCGNHMEQLKMIRYCKCGYADGIFVPKCSNPDHGTKYMVRHGSGINFVCSKCGKRANLPVVCKECHQKLEIKPALNSSHFIPFTISLIDLVDKRKDVFIENESDYRGEKAVIAQYLELIPQEQYEKIVADGRITQEEDFEKQLKAEADNLRQGGLDEATIEIVLDAKRRANPNGLVFESIAKVGQGLCVASNEELPPIAEEILEYDELVHARITLSLEGAEQDAELVNDGIRPEYRKIATEMGFSNVQVCSGVPIVTCAYGYTRHDREGQGVKLRGFPKEMEKKNVYAARLETEGVLFEVDRKKVIEWLISNDIIEPSDAPGIMDDYNLKMWFMDRIKTGLIAPFSPIDDTDKNGLITKSVYTLIHSISHALLHEASEICGLDNSSLSEYILPNIPAVFIYCSSSQGFNMGALYNAFQTHFDKWLKHARENSKKCIFDPICITHDKACAGCLFLNEVSCQHFNKDLDRSFLCGHFDVAKQVKIAGFWED